MREIKFRVWDKVIRKMFIVRELHFFGIGELEAVIVDYTDYGEKIIKRGDRIILIQYTGLKDKNGKEIYKGDILEIDWDWKSGEGERAEVRWDEKNATFRLFCYTKYGGEGWFMPENKTWTKLEIVGNIHENPELINSVA